MLNGHLKDAPTHILFRDISLVKHNKFRKSINFLQSA